MSPDPVPVPVLYSFRRCPYAIRARMAICRAGLSVELREVVLRSPPQLMLDRSPKGTVPVLVTSDDRVLEESHDIMVWALSRNDPADWLARNEDEREQIDSWIRLNDDTFKPLLDRYKYAVRYPQHPQSVYRDQASESLDILERQLAETLWLAGDRVTLADIALFPFFRQFAGVEPSWFETCAFANVRGWLQRHLESDIFRSVMKKYAAWQEGDAPLIFDCSGSEREN